MIVFSDKTGMERILFAVFTHDNFKLNKAAGGETVTDVMRPIGDRHRGSNVCRCPVRQVHAFLRRRYGHRGGFHPYLIHHILEYLLRSL